MELKNGSSGGGITTVTDNIVTVTSANTLTFVGATVTNSGGGNATVTVTGTSPLTTKGDLYGFSTVNARIPVGTDGFVLSADSTQILGVKWIAATGTGTVTSVASADSSITVTNPTTTVDLAVVKSPKLTTARTIGTTTGDATSAGSSFDGTANNTNALTLATVNSNVGTFGSATKASVVTVNGKGLVTAASESTVTPAVGSITGLGTGVATFLATPSSANLAAAVTDESGSGALVFANTPTLVTPVLGVATATSINKTAITAPATSSTLAVADGKTFTASNTITLTGTDSVSQNVSTAKITALGGNFDGGGSAIANGSTIYINCPYAGTITGYSILADTGTCTIKTWKIAAGTAIPTVANSISTSGVALASGTAIQSTTVTDFTSTTVTANDIFAFNITAIASATKISFQLIITKG